MGLWAIKQMAIGAGVGMLLTAPGAVAWLACNHAWLLAYSVTLPVAYGLWFDEDWGRTATLLALAVIAPTQACAHPEYYYRGIGIHCPDGLCYEPEGVALVIDSVLDRNFTITGDVWFTGDRPEIDGRPVGGWIISRRTADGVDFAAKVWWRPCLGRSSLAHELMHPRLILEYDQADAGIDHSYTHAWEAVRKVNNEIGCDHNALTPSIFE